MGRISFILFNVLLGGMFFGLLYGQEGSYFPPRGGWESRQASRFGIDTTQLGVAVRFALSHEYEGPRDLRLAILKGFEREPYHKIEGPTKERGGPAGMILKNGYLIAQWGDVKRVDMTFSVTKSFLSAVAGLSLDKGLISDTGDKLADYIWDGTFQGAHNSKISWEHLLQQTSDWSGEIWGGQDWADRPPATGSLDEWKFRELQEPGTVMEYNDVRVNVLAYALTQIFRAPLPAVLKVGIMDPIGASSGWRWFGYEDAWTEIDGIQMKSVTGGGHSGGGLFINTEDMARFGLLFLNRGNWDGTRLLSESWIEKALTPSGPNPNYGYLWWLNGKGEEQWEGLADTMYYAAGFGGNYIVIAPEQEMVVVSRWLQPSDLEEFLRMVFQALN